MVQNTSTTVSAGTQSSTLDAAAASDEPSSHTGAFPAQLSRERDGGWRLALGLVKHLGSPCHAASTPDPGLQPRSPAGDLLSPVQSQHTAGPCPPTLFAQPINQGYSPNSALQCTDTHKGTQKSPGFTSKC